MDNMVKTGLQIGVLLATSVSAAVLRDRTLVSWAAPATLDQRGGSALTICQGDRFDGLVFAELAKDTWMLGSDYWRRTCKEQKDWPKERTVDAFVQVAATYRDADRTVTLYRDGVAFASYAVSEGVETAFAGNDLQAIIGIRHPGRTDTFIGKVKDARIYDRALTAGQLAALKPGVMGGTRPFAWWNFATAGTCELTGRYAPGTLVGRAAIKDGALVLRHVHRPSACRDGGGMGREVARAGQRDGRLAPTARAHHAGSAPSVLPLRVHRRHRVAGRFQRRVLLERPLPPHVSLSRGGDARE